MTPDEQRLFSERGERLDAYRVTIARMRTETDRMRMALTESLDWLERALSDDPDNHALRNAISQVKEALGMARLGTGHD